MTDLPERSAVSSDLVLQRLDALLGHVGIRLGDDVDIQLDGQAPGCRPAVGEAAATAVAATAAAAGALWRLRGGERQRIDVAARHAGASLRSFMLLQLDGISPGGAPSDNTPLAEFYETRDGRQFFIHGVLPHLAAGTLDVLGLAEASYDGIMRAVRGWHALDLEDALAEARMCGAFARTPAEWDAHAQGRAIAPGGAVEIVRIGDAPPEPLPDADRPLGGVRVLDLTRILAGPSCGRTLAEHGAEVLLVSAEKLASVLSFVLDTGHGKRSAFLDLDDGAQRAHLTQLVAGCDVFSQGYRSGSLARRGLSPEELAAIRPGIVTVSVNCYGHAGPWVERPGWDQLGAAVTGLTTLQGGDGPPRLLPAAACDYVTGTLGALGAMAALHRRATEGGSWHVRISLAQTGVWLRNFAPLREPDVTPDFTAPAAYMTRTQTPLGELVHLKPVARMSATPPLWAQPPVPLGAHPPQWPASAAHAAR